MGTKNDDQKQQNEDGDGGKVSREHIRGLEEKAGKVDSLQDTNTSLQREVAFLKAGINPEDSKVAAGFVKAYDGELDSDAIVAEATEWGLLGNEQGSEGGGERETVEVSDDEKDLDDAASEAQLGSGADIQDDPDPYVKSRDEADAVMKTKGRADALAAAVGTIAQAAHAGDERVLVDS